MNQVKKQGQPTAITTWLRGHKRAAAEGIRMPLETPLSTFLTVITLAICFYLPLVMWLLWLNFSEIQKQWQQQGSIAVFVSENVDLQQLGLLQQELQERNLIEKVTLLRKDEIKQRLDSDPQLSTILGIIEEQALPHQLFLTPVPTANHDQLQRFVNGLILNPNIEYVSFDSEWFNQLKSLTNSFYYLMQASVLIFLIIVLVVLIYTIGTEVSRHQHEITLTQLLGATAAQIRRRFLYSGVYYGILAGMLALIFLFVSLWWVKQPIEELARNFATAISIRNILLQEGLFFFVITIAITWLGSRFALGNRLSQ